MESIKSLLFWARIVHSPLEQARKPASAGGLPTDCRFSSAPLQGKATGKLPLVLEGGADAGQGEEK